MSTPTARTIVDTYAKQQASLAAQLLRVLFGIWVPFAWASRPDFVNAAAAKSAVEVDIALSRARRLARSYEIAMLRELDALPTRLPPLEDMYPRSGTAIVEVYKRPARQYEHAIRQGKSPEEATLVLIERTEQIVTADLQAVARDEQSIIRQAAPKIVGFRRILHPERSQHGPCGLCVVAADRVYSKEDLLELHNGCVCTSMGFTADDDPGLSLNREDLDAIYEAAGSQFAEDLQRTRVTVHENGELGPILVRDGNAWKSAAQATSESKRGQKFTPYSRPTKVANRTNWVAMRATSERSIEILEDARRNGTNLVAMTPDSEPRPVTDIAKAIEYHRSLIARARAYGA